MTRFLAIASVGLCGLLLPAKGSAREDKANENLKRYEQKIDEQKDRLKKVLSREGSLQQELQRVSSKVDGLNQDVTRLRAGQNALDVRIKASSAEIAKLRKETESKRGDVRKRYRELYMWGPPNYLKIVLAAENPTDFRQRQYLAKRWLAMDEELIGNYRKQVDRLMTRKVQLESDQAERQVLLDKQSEAVKELASQKRERAEFLALVRTQREFYQKNIQELEQAAQDLQKLIETLQKEKGEEDSLFSRMRGRLPMPVVGKLEKKFGTYMDPKLNVKQYHKGIDLRASEGAPVNAVFDGRVVYAGWFVGYGKILILDHSGGYFTLYAHLNDVLKDLGSLVSAGELIARVGDSGSLKGAYLYFELRHKGISQDPWPWFAASSR